MTKNKYILSEEAEMDLEDVFEYTNLKFSFTREEIGSISKVGSKLKINFLCALNYLDE